MDLSSLNEYQRDAVTHDGSLLVLAGAGSGKTRVLTYKIAYLISEYNVPPYNILALTFTNKAASEMKERTCDLVGSFARDMWIMTFHACCTRILRMEIDALGRDKNFTIYDENDKKTIIANIMKQLNINDTKLNKNVVIHAISDAKNHSLEPLDLLESDAYYGKELGAIYREYTSAMQKANALDFDDLILTVITLFNKCPDVLERYRRRFQHVLIDEYQDTNMPQYELVRLLCLNNGGICVVGDDDQSIYAWRGADIRNILDFEQDFPGARVIRLEQNYRSCGNILKAANAVILNNTQRKGKNLWTNAGIGEPITHYTARDERDESNYICNRIAREVRDGARYSDFAVLYRTNAQSRVLEAALMGFGIPHRVYGGTRFFERMEIRDIMAYLKLLANNNDDAAFMRIINIPQRGIGAASVSALADVARRHGVSLYTALRQNVIAQELPLRTRAKFSDFLALMDELTIIKETEPASALAEKVIKLSDYVEHLKKEGDELGTRVENLDELVGSIVEIETGLDIADKSMALSLFLENAALISDTDDMDLKTNSVSLMTLHSAKGLEFHTVFVAGLEEGIFPSARSAYEPDKMEEERRLCYVGITRAKSRLYLLSAVCRRIYNQTLSHEKSRFIDEIPEYLMSFEGAQTLFSSSAGQHGYNGYSQRSIHNRSSSSKGYGESRTNAAYNQRSSTASGSFPSLGNAYAKTSLKKPAAREKSAKSNEKLARITDGTRISHALFGEGTVVSVAGSGDSTLITVQFDSGMEKKLAAAYAPLEIIG